MTTPQTNWKEAALIGALGGFCLVLLKLIQAGFYVDNVLSKVAIVAYLTYVCYVLFGAVAAVFFGEQDFQKNAFISGLLAPSILLSFFSAPNFRIESIGDSPKDIPKLSAIFVSEAQAQQVVSTAENAKQTDPAAAVSKITKSDVEPSFKEALLFALGKPQPLKDYLFVLGKTPDKAKAVATAASVNKLIKTPTTAELPPAQVIELKGSPFYLVVLGNLQKPSAALATKKLAYAFARYSLIESPDNQAKTIAPLLLDGKVIAARDLFK